MALPNQKPPGGKHVPSTAPGAGPRDLSGTLARHRQGSDARPSCPPGGYPETVGVNPDPPADRLASDDGNPGVSVGPAIGTGPARSMMGI